MWSEVGPQPVMISEVAAYLGIIGIDDPYTKQKYLRLVQAMDRVELQHIARKRK